MSRAFENVAECLSSFYKCLLILKKCFDIEVRSIFVEI